MRQPRRIPSPPRRQLRQAAPAWRLALAAALVMASCSWAFLLPVPGKGNSSPSARRPGLARSGLAAPSPLATSRTALFQQSTSSTPSTTAAKVPAKRRKALEAEYQKLAGKSGGVSFETLLTSAEIAELLREKLLARAEVEAFWQGEVGPKDVLANAEEFVCVYALVDALFEEDEDEEMVEEDEDEEDEEEPAAAAPAAAAAAPAAAAATGPTTSLEQFLASGDVGRYVEEGLVTKDEVAGFWRAECVAAGLQVAEGKELPGLGRDTTMRVYEAVEALLEDDDEEEAAPAPAAAAAAPAVPAVVVAPEDAELYAAFQGAVGKGGSRMDFGAFLKAGELPDLLADGLVTKEEAQRIWRGVAGAEAGATVEFAGFKALMAAIDDLFVEEEEAEAVEEAQPVSQAPATPAAAAAAAPTPAPAADGPVRPQLLALLDRVPFAGLLLEEEAGAVRTKAMDAEVTALVEAMVDDEANLAVRDDLEISELCRLIEGEWDLAYSTSRTMRYNRGLSGLGKSLPKAEFLGFEQRIAVNGYAYETVYTEKLRTLGRDLDVVVEGAWELRDVVSIMDGEVCLIMDVLPAQIKYGFITERLETGWKGVRVLNRCELLYLDEDLRIMKGQSNDSYFVFRRQKGSKK